MKKSILSIVIIALMSLCSLTANAVTHSIGYKLWDSNNGATATTDPSQLDQMGQVMHAQIKFDGVIHITASQAVLLEQFTILIANNLTFEDSGRDAVFSVNSSDPTILDITMASTIVTAQMNGAITIKAASETTGLIGGIKDADNQPVKLTPITSVQPTGLALEKTSETTGTASTPASVTYRMSSIPLVRGMNFLQARSNKSDNPNGYLSQETFVIHSHNFFEMTVRTHFNNLLTTANKTALENVGYTLELVETEDINNPHIRLTANTPSEGEELSWVVYHYPYRSEEESAMFDLFNSPTNGIVLPEAPPQWTAFAGDRSITLRGIRTGSLITIYQLDGRITASRTATAEEETIPVPSEGVYIVRVDGFSVRVIARRSPKQSSPSTSLRGQSPKQSRSCNDGEAFFSPDCRAASRLAMTKFSFYSPFNILFYVLKKFYFSIN